MGPKAMRKRPNARRCIPAARRVDRWAPAKLAGTSPAVKAMPTAQSMWPSAQWVTSVGIDKTAITSRLVPTAWRIRRPNTSRYSGINKKPPPFASNPVNSPNPAAEATSNGRFCRRRVPSSRAASSIGSSTRTPTTTRTTPDATSSAGPPTRRENNAPTIVAGTAPSSDHAAALWRASPLRTYGTAAIVAPGIVATSGEATATNGGTPSSDSTGVATDEPPTPKTPMRPPTTPPAKVMTGHGVILGPGTQLTSRWAWRVRQVKRISTPLGLGWRWYERRRDQFAAAAHVG